MPFFHLELICQVHNAPMHILLIEDNDEVADALKRGLSLANFTVDRVASAAQAAHAVQHFSSDLIILDLGLPDADGLSLLARWREQGVTLPVLVLTARDGLQDKVEGLQKGADDYVLKPFELDELVARIHALLRRVNGRATQTISHGDLQFDPALRELTKAGQVVDLPRKELALLEKFLYSGRRILTTEQLYDSLYGFGEEPDSNALNVHIYHLRKKLGKDIIETVRGLGYRLGRNEP